MQFSIVTPSYRNSKWLKLCIASVADQQGISFEHIVQDSCSDDGTQDWLPHDPRVKAFIEKDAGMYDGVNRGWKRAQGEFVAYLNCDEQFLPGALKAVADYFAAHPEIDVVVSDTVVVDTEGKYICHRKSMLPLKSHVWYRFPILTCAVFLRRKVLEINHHYFDTRWRDLGDLFWFKDLLNADVPMAVLREFTSAFTETGENMNLKPNAAREYQEKLAMVPKTIRRFSPLIFWYHRLRIVFSGLWIQKPFSYSLFTLANPDDRTVFQAKKPTIRWQRNIPKASMSIP